MGVHVVLRLSVQILPLALGPVRSRPASREAGEDVRGRRAPILQKASHFRPSQILGRSRARIWQIICPSVLHTSRIGLSLRASKI